MFSYGKNTAQAGDIPACGTQVFHVFEQVSSFTFSGPVSPPTKQTQ